MKQRLLLALLVLFASVGSTWSQSDFTPNGSTVTVKVSGIPVGKTITLKGTGYKQTSDGKSTTFTFDVPASASKTTITLGDEAAYTGLEFNGQVSSATLDQEKLATVTFKNNGGTLTSLTVTNAKLTSLDCENCGLTSLPQITDEQLGDRMTLNVKSNKLETITLPTGIAPAHAMTVSVDNNKITTIPAASKNVSIVWGTQRLEYKPEKNPVANEYFAVYTELIGDKIFKKIPEADKISSISDVTVSWNKTVKTNNAGDVVFYGGSTYNYGNDITCTIKHKANASSYPTYVYSMTVQPAQFGLTVSFGEGGSMAEPSESKVVKQGDILTFAPKANDGFAFDKYTEVNGLKVSSSNSNSFEVVGDKENPNVTINATFKALEYKVSHSGGANGTYAVKVDGKDVASNTTVTYGKTLSIETSPRTGYKARVKVNNKEITTENENVFTYIINKTTDSDFASTAKDVKIEVFFEASAAAYTLKVKRNNDGLATLSVNGKSQVFTGNTADIGSLQPGSIITLSATIKEGYSLQSILLGTTPLETKADISFEMPESDAVVTYNTIQKSAITLTAVEKTYTYTGKEQAFEYTVSPEGETGFTVKYYLSGVETKPIAAGTYDVTITRAETENYQAYKNESFKMEIEKATPVIDTKPTVTVPNGSVNYSISGGSVRLGTTSLMNTGKFSVTHDGTQQIENNICQITKSHLATVTFTVTGTEKDNFNPVSTQVAVKYRNEEAIKTVKIDWEGLPSDMVLSVKDGGAEIKKGSTVAVGTTVTITLKYPMGYSGVTLKENKAGAKNILEEAKTGTEGSFVTLTKDISVEEGMETLKVSYSGKAATTKYEISLGEIGSKPYDGKVQLVESDKVNVEVNGEDLTDASDIKISDARKVMTITYKDAEGNPVVSPVDAGKYTVCVKIGSLPGSDYTVEETTAEFKDALEITKATISITDWPTAATVGVGQTLDKADFVGGSAPVAGKFAFVDGTIKPTNGESYAIKYVPASSNYEELVPSDKKAKVTVSNLRVLSIDKVVNGTVTIVGNDGVTYKSGDAFPEAVTSIKVSATAATGYKLASLTVNGTAFTNGSSYTIGSNSVNVSVTFEEINEFTVSVSTLLKGIELVLPANKVVKKGESFSFSVKGLAADLAKLVVSDGAQKYAVTNGTCTITNITANKTITVTMEAGATPTPIDLTKIAEVVNSHMGKPMGTIKVEVVSVTRAASTTAYYGDQIKLTAVPASGCRFVKWIGAAVPASQATVNPLTIELTSAAYEITAQFAGSPTGAEVIEGVDIYGSNGEIVVKCDGAARITIVSMNGQSKQQEISGDTRIPAGAGIYGIVFEQGKNVMRTKVAVK